MREFETGATRDTDTDKLDFEGFLHPAVLVMYAEYMHKHRIQADGKVRDSDNWQKGIPQDAYMKSAFRHFMEWWAIHRSQDSLMPEERFEQLKESVNALVFNCFGYLFEELQQFHYPQGGLGDLGVAQFRLSAESVQDAVGRVVQFGPIEPGGFTKTVVADDPYVDPQRPSEPLAQGFGGVPLSSVDPSRVTTGGEL